MPLELVRNDITRMHVDAIVNATNRRMALSGGANGAVHKAAGPELLEYCRRLGGCPVGEARITPAYQLPCKYIIHTVGPVWRGGHCGEQEALARCYAHALGLAMAHGCRSIAFPVVAAGSRGYPTELSLKVATDAIRDFLQRYVPDNDLMVYLVAYTRESLTAGSRLFSDIRQYIDDHYVEEHYQRQVEMPLYWENRRLLSYTVSSCGSQPEEAPAGPREPDTLEDALRMLDESFSQMLLRKIQEKGMKNADCYKKANIDKKLFSKIVNNADYRPKKNTALALAIALELSLEETKELLMKAGLALSHSNKFDIIVEYFIAHKQYDIFQINEILYDFDQTLLGGAIL